MSDCPHMTKRGPRPGEQGGEYCTACEERMEKCSHPLVPVATEQMGKPIAACPWCGATEFPWTRQ
jgi:hypothetical protein